MGHLGDAARVVGDGSIGIHRHDDSGHRQHADGRKRHAVQPDLVAGVAEGHASEQVGQADHRHYEHDCGQRGELALCDAFDDDGCGACLGLLRDALDGPVVLGGEVLGGESDRPAAEQPHDDGHRQEDRGAELECICAVAEGRVAAEQHQRADDGEHHRERHRHVLTGVQLPRQAAAFAATHEERADDRRDHAERSDQDRKHEEPFGSAEVGGQAVTLEKDGYQQRGEHHRRHDRPCIGLEQVCTHAGHVAHVVAHRVGDGCGVAGIVLGDAGFYLAHEVAAHVGRFGVDAAADAGEQRDRAGTQPKGSHHLEGLVDAEPLHPQQVVERNAQQRQTGHSEAHDGPAFERQRQRLGGAHAGRLGRAGVCRGGDAHADEARNRREHRSHEVGEAGSRPPVDRHHKQQHEHGGHEDRHPLVLPAQERHGALADGCADLTHQIVALVGPQHHLGEVVRQQQRQRRGNQGQVRNSSHRDLTVSRRALGIEGDRCTGSEASYRRRQTPAARCGR